MTTIWVDVYDPAGTLVGEGPITTVMSASVTRVLDGAGSVSIRVPATDERAQRLLQLENRMRIYCERNGVTREIGRGIIRKRVTQVTNGEKVLSVDGPDELDLLKRVNTLLGRSYTASAASIAQSLASLAGWTTVITGGTNIIGARYDGASVLKALQELSDQQGLHLRLGSERTVEIGPFGEVIGLRLTNLQIGAPTAADNDEIGLIEQITVTEESEAVANWLLPLGQGEAKAALSLERCTRGTPYTVQTTAGPDGDTLYYLADAASIAEYGQIERVMSFRNIGAISNTDADIENAANALYDAAASWLQRAAIPLTRYRVRARKVQRTVRPGDKVRLTYEGEVTQHGEPHSYLDVDADYWVMSISESIGLDGLVVDMELASIDREAEDAAALVVGALEEITIRNLRVQTYANVLRYTDYEDLDSTHPATFAIELTDATTRLNRAKVRLTTRPFRSNTVGAASGGGAVVSSAAGGGSVIASASGGGSVVSSAAGGDHRHKVAAYDAAASATTERGYTVANAATGVGTYSIQIKGPAFDWFTREGSGNHSHDVNIPAHTHPITLPDHQHNVNIPAHTHGQEYGIFDDTQYPTTISILVDGVDRTAALGGPFAPISAAIDVTLDLTEFLVNAPGGLRQKHTLQIQCTGGRGRVDLVVELYETIQPIVLT